MRVTALVRSIRSCALLTVLVVETCLPPGASASASAAVASCRTINSPYHGTLCLPGGRGSHPAILLLGGSEGGDSMSGTASDFAAQGFVASSVEYFGGDGLPLAIGRTPIEIIGKAIRSIRDRRDVEPSRISLLGISRGGELALLVASHDPTVTAVVSVVGSPFAWGGSSDGTVPGWSYRGKGVPFLMATGRVYHQYLAREVLYRAIRDRQRVNAAFFHLEEINGPILFISAGNDETWDSVTMAKDAMAYLRSHPSCFRAENLVYPAVGHGFFLAAPASSDGNVDLPDLESSDLTVRYTAASTDAWKHILHSYKRKTSRTLRSASLVGRITYESARWRRTQDRIAMLRGGIDRCRRIAAAPQSSRALMVRTIRTIRGVAVLISGVVVASICCDLRVSAVTSPPLHSCSKVERHITEPAAYPSVAGHIRPSFSSS